MPHPPTLDDPLTRLLHLAGELVTPPGEPRRKFDLAHMRALLAALGNPHHRFPSVLIAGTNGKGSTAATLASILAAAGYSTGLYTSPHLERINERIQILRPGLPREIDDPTLFTHLARVEQASATLVANGSLPGPPSFFETVTAIAMLAFAAPWSPWAPPDAPAAPAAYAPVDIAILEVGLGGRLDATNVVEPLVSVITDISLDHTEWLGPTLSAIAREKAGILRKDGIMITLPQHPEVNQVLGEVAVPLNVRGINAADYLPGREASAFLINRYPLTLPTGEPLQVDSPLPGQHQQRNLALAIAAAIALRNNNSDKFPPDSGLSNRRSYTISNAHMEQGIRDTRWPARLERLALPDGRSLLLDVAHNPAGAWALRAAISQSPARPEPGAPGLAPQIPTPRHLLFGCMRDKAVDEIAQILFPVFDNVYLLELPSPRSASFAQLAAAAERTGASFTLCDTPAAALAAAAAHPSADLAAAGSVLLVGALRSLLAQPIPPDRGPARESLA